MASGNSGASLIEKRVEEQVLRALQEKEAAIDAALQQQQQQQQQQQDSDEELEKIRQQRKQQLQQRMQLLQQGHGVITELSEEKQFFEFAQKSKLLVLLFYRPSFALHEKLWALWGAFSARHITVRVCAINAEKAPFLSERLKIWCLPTAVLVRDGQTEHSIIGLDEIGGEKMSLKDLEDTMRRHKMLPPE